MEIADHIPVSTYERQMFIVYCIEAQPELLAKAEGIVTPEFFNREFDIFLSSMAPEEQTSYLQIVAQTNFSALYLLEFTTNTQKNVFTGQNWSKIEKHIKSILDEKGIYYGREEESSSPVPETASVNNSSSGSCSPAHVDTASSKSSGGCYIATAIYGSYDCPEVWTLRRFRDYTLAKTWRGRMFIKIYYTISPIIIKLFGKRRWFNRFWRGRLDRLVSSLKSRGYDDAPYRD